MKTGIIIGFLLFIPLVAGSRTLDCYLRDGICDDDEQAIAFLYDEYCASMGGAEDCAYKYSHYDYLTDKLVCCKVNGEVVVNICDPTNKTTHRMLNLNTTPGDDRGKVHTIQNPQGEPVCIGTSRHKIHCDYVPNPDITANKCHDICAPTHESCVMSFNMPANPEDSFKVSGCTENHNILRDRDTCICCSASDVPASIGEGYFTNVVITPFCSENIGHHDDICEMGEKIQLEASYVPISWSGTIVIEAEGGECTIQLSGGSIKGMDYDCPGNQTCRGNWTITRIPENCHYAEMSVTNVIFMKEIVGPAHPSFSTQGSQNFTLGPSYHLTETIEIESNVTRNDPDASFSTASPHVDWWTTGFGGQPFSCFKNDQFAYDTANISGWGVCSLLTSWVEKSVHTELLTADYFISIAGMFHNNNENQFTLTVDNTSVSIHPYFNTTTFGSISSDITYARFTIPKLFRLGHNSRIKINVTGRQFDEPRFALDYINITTEPFYPYVGNTEMKCGWFTDQSQMNVLGRSCNNTYPLPMTGVCANPSGIMADCAYANESGGQYPVPECFSFGQQTVNANGTTIQCDIFGNWCPEHFKLDILTRECYPVTDICDYGPDGNTENGCWDGMYPGRPGFLNDDILCLPDYRPPKDDPPYNTACCEFLRVPTSGDDYLFFYDKQVKIY